MKSGQTTAENDKNHGEYMNQLIDDDIAHIGRVMRLSLLGDLGGPILPSSYWRQRIRGLLATSWLSKAQQCAIDGLLLELDAFDEDMAAAPV